MTQFKIGDKVRRTKGTWYGVNPGDVHVVGSVDGSCLYLNGIHAEGFDARCFELVKDEPVKTPHKHAELIKAWADGALIQAFYTTNWIDTPNPMWWSAQSYRIKPEPKPDIVMYGAYNVRELLEHGPITDNKRAVNMCLLNEKTNIDTVKFTFDGETGKLKSVSLINKD